MNKKLVNFFDINIRNERFALSDGSKIEFKVNGILVALENISDTGIAVKTASDLPVNSKIELVLDNTRLFSLDAELIWKKDDVFAYKYTDTMLSENYVINLKNALDLKDRVIKINKRSNALDVKFLQICMCLKDFLRELKQACEKIDNDIYIQSMDAKEGAYDIAIKIFGYGAIDQIKKYAHTLDACLAKIDDKKKLEDHAGFFRENIGQYFISAAFTGRAYHKPRGYAGDYEMMNQIYRNSPEGNTLFEKIIHLYGINEASSISVRLRKEYLKKKIGSIRSNDKIVIGTLACGPAREILEFIQENDPDRTDKYQFVLMDQDHHALLNARRNIQKSLSQKKSNCEVNYLPLSVRQILENSEEAKVLEVLDFDLLYTAGLYDYLPQSVAKNLTKIISRSVKVNGEFIIGNFHPSNPTKTISDLVADWKLIHRNEEQMKDLIRDCGFRSSRLYFDDLGIDLFIEAIK